MRTAVSSVLTCTSGCPVPGANRLHPVAHCLYVPHVHLAVHYISSPRCLSIRVRMCHTWAALVVAGEVLMAAVTQVGAGKEVVARHTKRRGEKRW